MGVVHHMTETYRSLGGKLELNTGRTDSDQQGEIKH